VQNQASKDVVGKSPAIRSLQVSKVFFFRDSVFQWTKRGEENSPLMRQTAKIPLVGRVGLDPQTSREHELADRSREARQECVEGL